MNSDDNFSDEDFYNSDASMDDYDYMDDDDDDELDVVDQVDEYKRGNSYTILNEEDVLNRLDDYIVKVTSILSVSRDEAIVMLQHYNWNVDDVHEAWFADEEKVRKAVGILDAIIVVSIEGIAANHVVKTVRCGICFDDYGIDEMKSLNCRHYFCVTCWECYITSSINDGPGCLTLKCPTPKCEAFVGEDLIKMLVSKSDFRKYQHHLVKSYVEGSKLIKWCPAPDCENAVEYVVGSGSYDVICNCSYGFCWNCVNEVHSPVDCDTVMKWNRKNSNESENANWMLAYTKPCPKCKRAIEKNHGCMHMTCRPPCRHEFCWTCLRDYKTHGMCNTYKPVTEEGVVIDKDEIRRINAKNMLEKYMHYYERWAANHKSKEKARVDIEQMQNWHLDMICQRVCQTEAQVKFIIDAWLQIIECRRVLKWTYAYGYYFPENEKTKKQFFEYLQGEAEAGLERLHRCAEKELEECLIDEEEEEQGLVPKKDFNDYRRKLTDLTRITRTYFENLVSALEKGLEDVDSQKSSANGEGESSKKTADGKRKRSKGINGAKRIAKE